MGALCSGQTGQTEETNLKTTNEPKPTNDPKQTNEPKHNIILLTDSYKVSHWKQYPPGTQTVYSYFESRGCSENWQEVTFFGLQYFIKEYLVGQVVTKKTIEEAEKLSKYHFGATFIDESLTNPTNFNKEGWEYILEKHGGKLPIRIKAVPEGTTVATKSVLMTVENTDPKCFWLTNYLETLLVQVWYPMTVCSQSKEQKKIIAGFYRAQNLQMGKPPMGIGFSLNDFGFRGVSSVESAMLGGAAHLVNFIGTDNLAGIRCAETYYGAINTDGKKTMYGCPGFSIPASEHSTITSWGKENEEDAMRNMLTQYPEGLVACVSDSYDIWNACDKIWGEKLKGMIMERKQPGGRLVVRPDSGEPTEIVPKVLEKLLTKFSEYVKEWEVTGPEGKKKYRLLPSQIRVIQGDGVNHKSIQQILEILDAKGIAADNVVFGSGGALLQRMDRDTFKCAFKCSWIQGTDFARPVFKDPATDPGKKSKKGRLTLVKAANLSVIPTTWTKDNYYRAGDWITVFDNLGANLQDELQVVFEDGDIRNETTFDEIRMRADIDGGPFIGELPAKK